MLIVSVYKIRMLVLNNTEIWEDQQNVLHVVSFVIVGLCSLGGIFLFVFVSLKKQPEYQ